MVRTDARIVVLIVLVLLLAVFGLLYFSPSAHELSWEVCQKTQFHALNAAIELFNNEFDGYPPSDANDRVGHPYCGSMKLTEALMGQDLQGFHCGSVYRADGLDPNGLNPLYSTDPDKANLKLRRGPFLPPENASVCRLVDIYGKGNTGRFPESTLVLCDPYVQMRPSGEKTGMPILYYRASPSGTAHDLMNPDNPQNTFHYKDNQALIMLGVPGKPGETHPLADPKRFYLNTQDRKTSKSMPSWGNSFILISAGQDGLYGTADDICNFEGKYRKR